MISLIYLLFNYYEDDTGAGCLEPNNALKIKYNGIKINGKAIAAIAIPLEFTLIGNFS